MLDGPTTTSNSGTHAAARGTLMTSSMMGRLTHHVDSLQRRSVHFFIAPTTELHLNVAFADNGMGEFSVAGDPAAISLLSRLSSVGQDASTIRGTLAPMTPITLDDDAKELAGIPTRARFYAFAYPLDGLAADTASLLQLVIGSVSRLDDNLFFFFVLGGFVYFDEDKGFLQANAVSLKLTSRKLNFDGPYRMEPNAAQALKASGRLRPLPLRSLNDVGLMRFGWTNPSEEPNGSKLHTSVEWKSGAVSP